MAKGNSAVLRDALNIIADNLIKTAGTVESPALRDTIEDCAHELQALVALTYYARSGKPRKSRKPRRAPSPQYVPLNLQPPLDAIKRVFLKLWE